MFSQITSFTLFSACLLTPLLADQTVELFPAKAKEWKQAGPGKFSIKDGVATAEGGMGLWWSSGQSFKNATIDSEFALPEVSWNSGVFVRFPDPKNDPWVAVKKGYECQDCHAENGIMDFEKLGYTSARVEALQNLPELNTIGN